VRLTMSALLMSDMGLLLQKNKVTVHRFKPGEVVEGTVISKTEDSLLLDIGAKSEGIVTGQELKDDNETFQKAKVGGKVLATVLQAEDSRGYIVLSLRKAQPERDWKLLHKALKDGSLIEVEVTGPNKGGVVARFGSQRGFIPFSHLAIKNKMAANAGRLAGKVLSVKVIELDRDINRIVLSEREALTVKEREAEMEEIGKAKVGEVHEGEITSITPFGVFVKFGSLEGMVHVSDISWEKTDNAAQAGLKVSDKLKVKVMEVDEAGGKIILSHKATLPNPWGEVAKKYKEGSKVKGRVTKITDFGAFEELEPGIEGLIHVTETTGPLAEGDEVEARVLEVDPGKQKISLSLKAIGAGWR
jgi:small subunit ribosomal protein S1